MPNKKKRFFTKHNSTKFVLFTEGRDADGNKITENVLIPVSHSRVPGSSLLIQKLTGSCNSPQIDNDHKKSIQNRRKTTSESLAEKEANLEDILKNMDEESDSDEEYEAVKSKIKNLDFNEIKNFKYDSSKVEVRIEEGSDVSDEFEMGQFSDAESDDFHENSRKTSKVTSSKIEDCPENIKILNDCFEKLYEEYDENQIGALDDEEICGTFSMENEHMNNLICTPLERDEILVEIGKFDSGFKDKIWKILETDFPEEKVEITIEKPLEFDCESILSTYSNIYNHPRVIKEESKIKNIKIPHNPLQNKLTKSRLKQLESDSESDAESDDQMSVVTTLTLRPKGETPEQRRERKHLYKEAKRECRMMKKENKIAFKNEKKIQIQQQMNNRNNKLIKLL